MKVKLWEKYKEFAAAFLPPLMSWQVLAVIRRLEAEQIKKRFNQRSIYQHYGLKEERQGYNPYSHFGSKS